MIDSDATSYGPLARSQAEMSSYIVTESSRVSNRPDILEIP